MLGVLRRSWALMGPAFLVSVAYMDPGNWATAIEAGSRFGYELVWVVVLSNLIAILLQTLAARLGLVTGKHLAQVCREAYPPVVCVLLWVLCEVSIVALDLTMVLGTAIGLNLLFGWSVLPCILLTSLDALLLLLLVPRRGVRTSEFLTVLLVVAVLACFMVDLMLSAPPLGAVLGGLVPRLQRDSVYVAVCLLGANVMPHNFLLHSALVCGQAKARASTSLSQLCWYNFFDIAAALGLALVVNVAVLLVAAATFHQAGIVVGTLQEAHDLMESLLSSRVAPAAFGLALLAAGQLSTFTGTIAGQVVLVGFLNIRLPTWVRRLATRGAAVLPAALLQALGGDRLSYRFLLMAQVVLALQLPFVLVPLIKATSSKQLMGPHRNSTLLAAGAWASCGLVFVANLGLFVSELWPGAALVPHVEPDGPESSFRHYLEVLSSLAWSAPATFVLVLGLILGAALLLALQLWVIVTPLKIRSDSSGLLAKHTSSTNSDVGGSGGATQTAAAPAAAAGAGAAAPDWRAKPDVVVTAAAASQELTAAAAAVDAVNHQQQPPHHVSLNWSVPRVAEWLMGSSTAAAGGGAGDSRYTADVAVCVSGGSSSPSRLLHPRHGRSPLITVPASYLQLATIRTAAAADAEPGEEQQEELLLLLPPTPSAVSSADGEELPTDWEAASKAGKTCATAAAAAAATDSAEAGQQRQQRPRRPQMVPCHHPQQQQQQQQPQSPSVSLRSAGSSTWELDTLRADREQWLLPPTPPPPPHSSAQHATQPLRTHSSSGSSTVQQQQQQGVSYAAAAGAGGPMQHAHSGPQLPLQRVGSSSDAGSVMSGVSAAGDGLSKSGRRQFAAVLEAFWVAYCDTHGNWFGAAGTSSSSSSTRQSHTPHCCSRCGSAVVRSNSGCGGGARWCVACCGAVVSHLQACVADLLAIPGAAKLLLLVADGAAPPPPAQEQQQVAAADVTATAAAALVGLWQQLPSALQQHVQQLMAAPSAVQQQQQCQQQQCQQQQSAGSSASSSSSTPGVSGDTMRPAAAPAYLLSWGMWCILLLLVLSQAEVRPELWGRYAAGLNRLQGCLGLLPSPPQQQQQQQQQELPAPPAELSAAAAAVWQAGEAAQLHQTVLALLLQLEGSIQQRKAPTGAGGSVGAAFAKGKEILTSVVKRYRRRLCGGQQQQQQQWGGGGGGGGMGSNRGHGGSSSGASPRSPYGRGGVRGGGEFGGGRGGRLMLGVLMLAGVGLVAVCSQPGWDVSLQAVALLCR